MSDAVVLKTKKLVNNKLLNRRQMLVEVQHGSKPGISRKELREKLASMYKVKDPNTIVVYGLQARFGGGVTDGFALIYDNVESLKRVEPGFRMKKNGHEWTHPHTGTTRKQRKEKKNKRKISVGTAKRAAKKAAKKKD